jgi:hypothetical protein
MGVPIIKRDKYRDVLSCLLRGLSIRKTSELTGVARNTIAKWCIPELVEGVRLLRPQCLPVIEPPPKKILSDAVDTST